MRMQKYFRFILFIVITQLVFVAPSFSAPLNLNDLIAIAIQNNKDLQAAKYNVGLAKARLLQAGALPNPSLELANANDRVFQNEGEYATKVGLSQDFPIGGRIAKQKEVARVDLAIAETEILEAERKLSSQVTENYFNLIVTMRRLTQMKHLIDISGALTNAARDRFRLGEVSELDANTAQLEHQRLQHEKRVLKSQQASQIAQLNTLLGRTAQMPLVVSEQLPSPLSLPHLTELQQLAMRQRSDFLATWLSLNRAQADMSLARAQRWADWKIGVGVDQGRRVIQGAPPQQVDRLLAVSLSIPLPLLNQNQGRIDEASAAQAKAQASIQALKLTIEAEVATNYHQVQSLLRILKKAKDGFIPLSNKNASLARNAYQSGQVSLFEVLQVYRQQNDLYLLYLTTLEQYLQSWMKLQNAVGGKV